MMQALTTPCPRETFGGKAASLSEATRAGLPVPRGIALSVQAADAIATGDTQLAATLRATVDTWGPLAVRSSALAEDGDTASFAGQFKSVLGVTSEQLEAAVAEVVVSAASEAVEAYRTRMGLLGGSQMAVVVQELVPARCAGVMFTRDPITGADHRVVEASWGLGEVVVGGLVEPDRVVFSRDGEVRSKTVGFKDVTVVNGREQPVEAALVEAPCLEDADVAALANLARRVEAAYDTPSDIEWAFSGSDLFLLQRRGVTR